MVRSLIPYLAWAIGAGIRLVFYSIISLITGVPRAVELTADDWTQRASSFGIPQEYNSLINLGAGVVSLIAIIGGLCILVTFMGGMASIALDVFF